VQRGTKWDWQPFVASKAYLVVTAAALSNLWHIEKVGFIHRILNWICMCHALKLFQTMVHGYPIQIFPIQIWISSRRLRFQSCPFIDNDDFEAIIDVLWTARTPPWCRKWRLQVEFVRDETDLHNPILRSTMALLKGKYAAFAAGDGTSWLVRRRCYHLRITPAAKVASLMSMMAMANQSWSTRFTFFVLFAWWMAKGFDDGFSDVVGGSLA
jgi:hypothetical protein